VSGLAADEIKAKLREMRYPRQSRPSTEQQVRFIMVMSGVPTGRQSRLPAAVCRTF
jgi:hypothetical protein